AATSDTKNDKDANKYVKNKSLITVPSIKSKRIAANTVAIHVLRADIVLADCAPAVKANTLHRFGSTTICHAGFGKLYVFE
ncbi:hypothetical protein, partial [Rheinheimera soli]|uniref:hypothetical protein n=1 Tax=Rheinheimera soli TaxID=443616 RepID=UPI001E5482BA